MLGGNISLNAKNGFNVTLVVRTQIQAQERLPIGSRSSLCSHVIEHNRNNEKLEKQGCFVIIRD